ncbi:tyrosine-type recombinase/integrase [Sphaerimonospora sp. CA-214678]|uniref:tyrosine-type recombinase/integrase n=1 Tax=Sphaerimonospora sp. CA-214678 TaxID=3240029 RepID=UPI003D8D6157
MTGGSSAVVPETQTMPAAIDKDAGVHDARHTAATPFLEQGMDMRVVQVILGHSQLTTTKRYTHVTANPAGDAMTRMDRVLWDDGTIPQLQPERRPGRPSSDHHSGVCPAH